MRTFLVCLLGALALGIASVAAEESDCDMKTVAKMHYCESDMLVLEKSDLVSDATYYECAECDGRYATPGECPDCEGSTLVKKTSGKNACKHCFGPTVEVEACVKEYYVCDACGEESTSPGKCSGCEEPQAMVKQVSRAVITYQCDGCGTSVYKAGKCTDADCEDKGKALVRRCSMAGEYPHVR